jgi:hypothetical protein
MAILGLLEIASFIGGGVCFTMVAATKNYEKKAKYSMWGILCMCALIVCVNIPIH